MATRTSECRKFSPNIFNKSKCSHCFRQREEHSAAALECNRASRKVSKCGYMFVAPDWDFNNPLYRTKRWQRRWFVLYDDGELTYSVDEHPETVPQASIDMTKVLEVTTAEDVTGHSNSIAVTAPDRVTFVKGTCPEESKWWLNILATFPKSKGRHKRNATFPGGQATTILQSSNDPGRTMRNRHNSYHKDALTSAGQAIGVGKNSLWNDSNNIGNDNNNNDDDDNDDNDNDDGDESNDEIIVDDRSSPSHRGQDEDSRNAGNETTNRVYTDQPVSSKSPPTRDKINPDNKAQVRIRNRNRITSSSSNVQDNTESVSPCLLIEDVRRDEKLKDIANTITNLSQQKSRWSNATTVSGGEVLNNAINSHHLMKNTAIIVGQIDEKPTRDETDFHSSTGKPIAQTTTVINLRPKTLPLSSSSTPAIVSAIVKKIPPVLVQSNVKGTPSAVPLSSVADSGGAGGEKTLKSSPRIQLQLRHLQLQQQQQQQQQQQLQQYHHHYHHKLQHKNLKAQQAHERGDPDGGCNLDDLSTNYFVKTSELRVNLPAEELLNSKKGWLMKQDNRTSEWTKHWFTLSGAALFYYRDPVSEERGVLDGVLDVNSLTNVNEITASRNYAFQLTTWDKRRLILSSLSPNSRKTWIAVLRNASGLPSLSPVSVTTTIVTNTNSSSSPKTTVDDDHQMKMSPTTTELIIKDNTSDDIKTEIEKDFIKAQRNQELILQSVVQQQETSGSGNVSNCKSSGQDVMMTDGAIILATIPPASSSSSATVTVQQTTATTTATANTPVVTPPRLKTIVLSSDEEYRTASEGGRRDSIDWGSPLSPSPPIPLALFRTKEHIRSRTSNCSRFHKRSRSSPPSSRRSTVDSVGSDELPIIHPVEEELNLDKELHFRLSIAEKERDILRDEAKKREARMSELLVTLERTEQELSARIREMEEARNSLSAQLDEAKRNAEKIVDRLNDELQDGQKKIKNLEDRLAQGIEENETLYKRWREMENCSPSSSFISSLNRSKLKRMDSLSDLTQITDIDPYCLDRNLLADEYNELRSRFEKAVNEIKVMKRELKESQNQYDTLEISYASLKQDLERKEIEDRSQLQMMAERIQDLTLKYSGSEKQVRTLKQKLAKSERRRSLSLKGKEQLTVSKELELKVNELETKIDELEKSSSVDKSDSSPPETVTKYSTPSASSSTSLHKSIRRTSLESSASADSLQFMVRLNDLEKRFDSMSGSPRSSAASTPTIDIGGRGSSSLVKVPEHLVDRLRSLEGLLVGCKDRLEQSLQQLQSLRSSSRTRRSVSPITDRKESFRFVERSIGEIIKMIRESCDNCITTTTISTAPGLAYPTESSPIKTALIHLESQLHTKLAELLKQRRCFRERNELTPRKSLELLAERIAFEGVCFGKLRESVGRAENPDELFGQRQTRAEITETSYLMAILKSKLAGKCTFKTNGSLDFLASVLARRLVLSTFRKDAVKRPAELVPVEPAILEELLRQQNEINCIAKRYRNNAMETLASGLAAETLSYITTSNDLVQGVVQEAWRQAQETVNAELVQSEIAHIMARSAERFESSITPSYGYTLTAEERVTFEVFSDAVNETLRKEMDSTVAQLTQCYEDALEKMKRGQWRTHLEHERKANEGRQLLSEFSDIIAHKALVDARVAVLRGDYVSPIVTVSSEQMPPMPLPITSLEKYEKIFEEVSNDMQISNPEDILAEVDFDFMYKNRTIEFVDDGRVLKEIKTCLIDLEDSLVRLQMLASSSSSPGSSRRLENFHDICQKCCELQQRTEQIVNDLQQKYNAPCPKCSEMQESIRSLQSHHETQLLQLQQDHAKHMTMLMKQVESHHNAVENLEAERNSMIDEIRQQHSIVEDHERKLDVLTTSLKSKHEECHCKANENLDLIDRLAEREKRLRSMELERDALAMKCSRQDEEYAVLLQERDFVQTELNKERERCRRLDKRLEMLELEHGKQLECLQEAYRDQILSHCSDFTNIADEESFRQRYQAEIEQLRTLCEKGLTAMESSHRRVISDLEERHRHEIERLCIEKETALAEETQATLAALDAMRKAHQSEVQREVARFKQEFLRQFQKGDHSLDTTKVKEEELEELRQEILSFSEKYSIKCVENAALEEKLRSANQKLKHFQQMQQIELRNKQFRAHLASDDPASDSNFFQGLVTSKDDPPYPDSEHVHANNQCRTLSKSESFTTQPQPQSASAQSPQSPKSLPLSLLPTIATSTTTTATTTTAKDQLRLNLKKDNVEHSLTCKLAQSTVSFSSTSLLIDNREKDLSHLPISNENNSCGQITQKIQYQKGMTFEGLSTTTGTHLPIKQNKSNSSLMQRKLTTPKICETTTTTTTSTSTSTSSSSSSQPKNQNGEQQQKLYKTEKIINISLKSFNNKNNSKYHNNDDNNYNNNNNNNNEQQKLTISSPSSSTKCNKNNKINLCEKSMTTKPVRQPKNYNNHNYNNHFYKTNPIYNNNNNNNNNHNRYYNTKRESPKVMSSQLKLTNFSNLNSSSSCSSSSSNNGSNNYYNYFNINQKYKLKMSPTTTAAAATTPESSSSSSSSSSPLPSSMMSHNSEANSKIQKSTIYKTTVLFAATPLMLRNTVNGNKIESKLAISLGSFSHIIRKSGISNNNNNNADEEQ